MGIAFFRIFVKSTIYELLMIVPEPAMMARHAMFNFGYKSLFFEIEGTSKPIIKSLWDLRFFQIIKIEIGSQYFTMLKN